MGKFWNAFGSKNIDVLGLLPLSMDEAFDDVGEGKLNVCVQSSDGEGNWCCNKLILSACT